VNDVSRPALAHRQDLAIPRGPRNLNDVADAQAAIVGESKRTPQPARRVAPNQIELLGRPRAVAFGLMGWARQQGIAQRRLLPQVAAQTADIDLCSPN